MDQLELINKQHIVWCWYGVVLLGVFVCVLRNLGILCENWFIDVWGYESPIVKVCFVLHNTKH